MRRGLRFAGLLFGALLALPALAREGDTFQPFVSLGYNYDSNLFRQADNTNPGIPHDDRYSVLSAGLNVDWKPARQEIVASATKSQVRFVRNTPYNNNGSDYQAKWNWRLGNRLSGNLGAAESLSQSNFASVGLVNNLVSQQRRFGRAEWEFHPRWRIGGGIEQTENSNSATTQVSQNFKQQVRDAVLTYLTPKGSNLKLQVRKTTAEFPNLQILGYIFVPIVAVSDNSYTQTEYDLLGNWSVSGKLKLHGQVGRVDRSYDNILRNNYGGLAVLVPRPNFSGFTGRLSGDWYATGKTLLSVSLYQEPGGAQDINASSVIRKGASVNWAWLVREKWQVNAGATFENRDFKGDPNSLSTQRNDDTLGASLSLSYTPIQAVSLNVGMSAGRRNSNITVEDYKFHTIFANVRADF